MTEEDGKILVKAKVGDTVEWTSQAAGSRRTKRGTVIEVVPRDELPKTKLKDNGLQRPHESYVVRASVIDGSEAQRRRKQKYWPRVSQLRVVHEETDE